MPVFRAESRRAGACAHVPSGSQTRLPCSFFCGSCAGPHPVRTAGEAYAAPLRFFAERAAGRRMLRGGPSALRGMQTGAGIRPAFWRQIFAAPAPCSAAF